MRIEDIRPGMTIRLTRYENLKPYQLHHFHHVGTVLDAPSGGYVKCRFRYVEHGFMTDYLALPEELEEYSILHSVRSR